MSEEIWEASKVVTTAEITHMYADELEAEAHSLVGGIIFAWSNLELNLGLCLRCVIGGRDVRAVNPLLQRMGLKARLDALRDVAEHKFGANSECYKDINAWHKRVDALRITRNAMVHGRWGVSSTSQQVINVGPELPDSVKPARETRYTLEGLRKQLDEVVSADNEFFKLRRQHGL